MYWTCISGGWPCIPDRNGCNSIIKFSHIPKITDPMPNQGFWVFYIQGEGVHSDHSDIYIYVCMHACMYVCVCMCVCIIYIYIYICIYACIYICIYHKVNVVSRARNSELPLQAQIPSTTRQKPGCSYDTTCPTRLVNQRWRSFFSSPGIVANLISLWSL